MEAIINWYKKTKWALPAIIGVGVIIVMLFVNFLIGNSVTNAGNKQEATLNAQYLDNQNYLSDCVLRIRESAGVVKGEAAALDEILTNAVKGRYDEGSSAQVGGGQLFSAIVEAYPDLSGLSDGFDKVLAVVNGCRTDFRGKQTEMLDKLKAYDQWRTGSWTVRHYGDGFPSNNLQARIGTTVKRGQDAYDQMFLIVTINGNDEAFETGETEAEDPFGTNTTTGG